MSLNINRAPAITGLALAGALCLPLAACHDAKPAPVGQGDIHPEKGEAVVNSVDGATRSMRVQLGDKTITAWWDQNTAFFDGTVQATPADVKPGDVVTFRGLEANGETYVGVVQIVRKPQ